MKPQGLMLARQLYPSLCSPYPYLILTQCIFLNHSQKMTWKPKSWRRTDRMTNWQGYGKSESETTDVVRTFFRCQNRLVGWEIFMASRASICRQTWYGTLVVSGSSGARRARRMEFCWCGPPRIILHPTLLRLVMLPPPEIYGASLEPSHGSLVYTQPSVVLRSVG